VLGEGPVVSRHADGAAGAPVLVWRFDEPLLTVSSAPLGGGLGKRSWMLNAQVSREYARTDIDAHLETIATAHGLDGAGIGMLTAARVECFTTAQDGDVCVYATVGVSAPTWAADADDAVSAYRAGTINVFSFVDVPLRDAALVNAVMTATEAKAQALFERGVPGTGTASDALCVACPIGGRGDRERFAGPRSRVGASLARAVHAAVLAGLPKR
jgi:adenosylcobinamide amidohydrolase